MTRGRLFVKEELQPDRSGIWNSLSAEGSEPRHVCVFFIVSAGWAILALIALVVGRCRKTDWRSLGYLVEVSCLTGGITGVGDMSAVSLQSSSIFSRKHSSQY